MVCVCVGVCGCGGGCVLGGSHILGCRIFALIRSVKNNWCTQGGEL